MVGYRRLGLEERELIAARLAAGWSVRRIAADLGRSHSTVSRELQRCKTTAYVAATAQRLSASKPKRGSKVSRLLSLHYEVIKGLKRCWSPEQIAGRLRREGARVYASHETIYRYIYSEQGMATGLPQLLAKRKPKRGRKPTRKLRGIPHATPIAQRIAPRSQLGHWEADLVLFGFNSTQNITTLVERNTRYTAALLNHGKYAQPIMERIAQWLETLPRKAKQSLTFDRGTEFSKHHKLDVETYFCDPGSPWQKGTNENTNGRLRRFLPKKMNTQNLTQQMLDMIVETMNNTPRKCLNYQTPNEAFKAAIKSKWCAAD